LGSTAFKQLGWTEAFNAGLDGEFFTHLKLMPAPGGVELRKNHVSVSNFSGSLALTVTAAIRKEPHWMGSSSSMVMGGWRFTDALRGLRFRLNWGGSESRDLGEVPAELKSQVLVKNFPPENWYEMEVPAQDVPITDSLEIHILSAAGSQIGCISGHI
jgi:hypothetical protein